MITQIELEAMHFYAYHGVTPQERTVGNHFSVTLRLTAPLEQAVANDNLADTINYASVYETVHTEMTRPSHLIEHAAGRILHALKTRFPQLTTIEIKLSKLNPPFGGDLQAASIVLQEKY